MIKSRIQHGFLGVLALILAVTVTADSGPNHQQPSDQFGTSGGNINDITEAPKLVEKAQGQNFIGDKGYDSNAVIEAIEAKGMTAVIPSNPSRSKKRKIDSDLYKERHLVENYFCNLKRYRRVATRYEKTAVNFLGFILFASLRLWLA